MAINKKINALYERLSRDDEMVGDSNSIINQKKMLEDYTKKNERKERRDNATILYHTCASK